MMLSSGGEYGDVSRCRELGIAAYLTKPVKQSICSTRSPRIVDGATAARTRAVLALPTEYRIPSPVGAASRGQCRQSARGDGTYDEARSRGDVASNGREVLAELERQSFDVVLMDVQMPEMGGFETAKAIRARERETRGAHAHHRHDRACDGRGSGAMPRGRNGRLPVETHRSAGAVRGHRR